MGAEAVVDDRFRMPDALFERMQRLLPRRPRPGPGGGRPPLPWRTVLDGIFHVLRTGCQWKAVPRGFASGSSLHRYFQDLVAKGVFARLWRLALREYDDLVGLQWKWQSMDGAMTKAPLGGGKNRQESHRPRQARQQTQHAVRRPRGAAGSRHRRRQHARHAAG